MKWFRLYSEARTDAKLESLPDDMFRVWFKLMCFAGEQPTRGFVEGYDDDLLAVEVARGDVELLRATLARLVKLRIIVAGDDAVLICNWEARQYDKPSDTPEETRRRKQESRARHADVTPRHDPYADADADTDSETETEITAPDADVAELDLTDGEREVVQHIRAVRGLASVSEAEVALHLREVLSARDGPPLSRAALRLDAIRFRDKWTEKRSNAPPNQRWRGWKSAVTNWFSKTYELKANGKAPETIPDRVAHRDKHLTRYHFDNAPERAAS